MDAAVMPVARVMSVLRQSAQPELGGLPESWLEELIDGHTVDTGV